MLLGHLPEDASENFRELFQGGVISLPRKHGGIYLEGKTSVCHASATREIWAYMTRCLLNAIEESYGKNYFQCDDDQEKQNFLDDTIWHKNEKVYKDKYGFTVNTTDLIAFNEFCSTRAEFMRQDGHKFNTPLSIYRHDNTNVWQMPKGLNSCDDFVVNYMNVAKLFTTIGEDQYAIVTSDMNAEKRFQKLLESPQIKLVRTTPFIFGKTSRKFQSRQPFIDRSSAY